MLFPFSHRAGHSGATTARWRRRAVPKPRVQPRVEPLEGRSLLSASSLDSSFGMNGLVTNATYGGQERGNAVALEPNGQIVVAGSYTIVAGTPAQAASLMNANWAVLRFNPDGSLDTSFGSGGKPVNPFPTGTVASADAVVVEPNGKILVGGEYAATTGAELPSSLSMVLVQYNPDGTLDTTFGNNGVVTGAMLPLNLVRGLALQPNGQIVVVGTPSAPTSGAATLDVARFNANGTLDTTFGTNGLASVTLGDGSAMTAANAVAIESDGTIVVGGTAGLSGQSVFALASFSPAGSVVNTVTTNVGAFSSSINALALQSNGQILAVGAAGSVGSQIFALARYNENLTLDTTFGTNGTVLSNFGAGIVAQGVALMPNGEIVVTGGNATVDSGNLGAFATALYNANGSLDTTFGVDGLVATPFPGVNSAATGVVVQPDGKIVVAGTVNNSDGTSDIALARYLGSSQPTPPVYTITASGIFFRTHRDQPFLYPVAWFTTTAPSPNASDFQSLIDWNDGTSSSGFVVRNRRGSFFVIGIHRYVLPGFYQTTTTIRDLQGDTATADGGILVV
jgi:uncharacterized delta-60 repeat protein